MEIPTLCNVPEAACFEIYSFLSPFALGCVSPVSRAMLTTASQCTRELEITHCRALLYDPSRSDSLSLLDAYAQGTISSEAMAYSLLASKRCHDYLHHCLKALSYFDSEARCVRSAKLGLSNGVAQWWNAYSSERHLVQCWRLPEAARLIATILQEDDSFIEYFDATLNEHLSSISEELQEGNAGCVAEELLLPLISSGLHVELFKSESMHEALHNIIFSQARLFEKRLREGDPKLHPFQNFTPESSFAVLASKVVRTAVSDDAVERIDTGCFADYDQLRADVQECTELNGVRAELIFYLYGCLAREIRSGGSRFLIEQNIFFDMLVLSSVCLSVGGSAAFQRSARLGCMSRILAETKRVRSVFLSGFDQLQRLERAILSWRFCPGYNFVGAQIA